MAKMYVEVEFVGRNKFDRARMGQYFDLKETVIVNSPAAISAMEQAKAKIETNYTVASWTTFTGKGLVPLPMTAEEYAIAEAEVFEDVPQEFRGKLSYMAYERGHSAGYEECLGILKGFVSDLSEPIKVFEARIRAEAAVPARPTCRNTTMLADKK